MSHYLVELYTPNAAWRTLSTALRQQFIASIVQAMGQLSEMGVEIVALGQTAQEIDCPTTHEFVGIWRFSTPEARKALLAGIKASGWYTYFDHINASCDNDTFASHLHQLETC
ncbi:hypothetical protein E9531_10260 [Lampropedia puyangensis]|uniref:Uncharacterized protein n=1 Tax=Lampropedia puyangensis TaxID=1330072 RepID=A0A4S8F117_9BURK|nr:DUF6616 family protein [Lampropedia puyangensis]THU00647.1 hypothetical protein E9531_10260 [Lampropedia puyangensis]